jgi:hypothetical protein
MNQPQSITGGLGLRPQHGLRITTRYPASPPTSGEEAEAGKRCGWGSRKALWVGKQEERCGSILHGEDFPRTLMRGSPAGAVEPVRHRQETLDLAAWRD